MFARVASQNKFKLPYRCNFILAKLCDKINIVFVIQVAIQHK